VNRAPRRAKIGGSVASPLDPALTRAIREAPKVELHLHLDGAMSLPWLLQRIRRRPDPPLRTLAELRSRLRYRSFDEFIERWVWKCGFLDRYADFESLAESVLRDLAGQGVVHVEPSFSPGDYERHGLETPGLVEAVLRGAERASRATGIGFGLVIDLIRDHGPAVAARRLAAVSPYRGEGVVAVGLGGNEPAHPAPLFAEVFAEAARLGFHRTAHAGEAAGPASIRDTLDTLGVERIGHGIRAIEDSTLVARLAREGVPLEVCPTSNVRTGVVGSYARHPLPRLVEAGVRVTVNSDDPTFFGANLLDEYLCCLTRFRLGPRTLAGLALNAAEAAFVDGAARGALIDRVRRGWASVH
jgi:adenosine deaminase